MRETSLVSRSQLLIDEGGQVGTELIALAIKTWFAVV